jgi:hypothetical protein
VSAIAYHPFADVFPPIEGVEFERLVTDIAENGLLNPITMREESGCCQLFAAHCRQRWNRRESGVSRPLSARHQRGVTGND